MEYLYDPKKIVKIESPDQDDYLEEKEEIEFNIGQHYKETPARTLVCKHCKNEEFKVAIDYCFTAIKCINCEYEICIHDG